MKPCLLPYAIAYGCPAAGPTVWLCVHCSLYEGLLHVPCQMQAGVLGPTCSAYFQVGWVQEGTFAMIQVDHDWRQIGGSLFA